MSRTVAQGNGGGGGISKAHGATSTNMKGARVPTTTTTTSSSGVSGNRPRPPPSSSSSSKAVLSIAEQQESWNRARQIHQQQLLTEHFGFAPLSFVDDVINSVNNMIYQASMALQDFVEREMEDMHRQGQLVLQKNVHVLDESAKCMHKFETLLESAVDRNFDRFELYALKNLFGVPEKVDIVLPHYEELDFEISVDKDQKLDEELELLRRQVIATKALNYRLRKELEVEEKRRRQLERCREQIIFLREAVQHYSDVAPVPQTLIFVRENIEVLHRRFEEFHQRLQKSIKDHSNSPTTPTPSSSSSSQAVVPTTTPTGPGYPPSENIAQALREILLSLEPDQRAIYIRSVVQRQIEEHLDLDPAATTAAVPITPATTAIAAGVVPTMGTSQSSGSSSQY